jgi:hypothetical protein
MQEFPSMQALAHCEQMHAMTWSAKGWAAHDSCM